MPRAPRTVGSAIAANTIGYLIPCHRVIRAGGEIGDYRWGSARKLALLGREAARLDA
ncbi:MAG: AraC family transcriptional regulator [Rhodocyclaceae bacterium]|nr:AraC family transcriptional regulator [Rhodocyclaceae bacterium]